MVCIPCCSKLKQISDFFERSLKAQAVLQKTARIQNGATADDVGVRKDIHFYIQMVGNFRSSLSVFTGSGSTKQRFF
jgi:hypothetical protein